MIQIKSTPGIDSTLSYLPQGTIFTIVANNDNIVWLKTDEMVGKCFRCTSLSKKSLGYIGHFSEDSTVQTYKVVTDAVLELNSP